MISFSKKSEFPVSVEELFAWHERPGAFARLAPPWQSVELVKHEGGIRDGAKVHVQTKVGGIAQTWKMRHEGYIANERFIDVMESGPFSSWKHQHLFSEGPSEHSSILEDKLEIKPLGGAVGDWLQSGFVHSELEPVFNYRHTLKREDLKRAKTLGDLAFSGKVLITGVTGMVGRAVAAYLQTRGYHVLGVSRSRRGPWPGLETVAWDPAKTTIDPSALEGVEAVINLAGESILGVWSHEKTRRIKASREQGALTLLKGFEATGHWPKVWINASGSGFYGPKTQGTVDESNESGSGFLAHVCRAWEDILEPARAHSRVITARLGTVMSPAGGALGLMLPVFKLGAGGVLGHPKASMPWIGLDDVVYGMEHLFYTDSTGPVNFVAPEILTQRALAKTLGKVLKRPTILPAPAGLLKQTLGSLAKEVFLIDQRVAPKVLESSGFEFTAASFEEMLIRSLGLR